MIKVCLKSLRLLIVASFLLSPLWAGREFPVPPGAETVPNELLVKLKPGAAAPSVFSAHAPGAQHRPLHSLKTHLLKFRSGLPPGLAKRIAKDPSVEYVESNLVRRALVQAPNDPSYSLQWALQNVEALQAWRYVPNRYLTAADAGSGRIKVAILDTGADCTHFDFMNTGGSSTDSAQGGQLSFASSQAIVQTVMPQPACSWLDDNGHGTHVAGIVAAAANNGQGVASLGYPLEVVVYKVLNFQGSGSDANVASAITASTDAGVHIISMSLGGEGYSQTLQDAINYAWEHNVLVIAASGNSNSNVLTFPAGANYALGVASTNSAGNKSFFSNFGNSVDIAAPGESILSLWPTYPTPSSFFTNFAYLSGTSMATPHVSALAGLVTMTTPDLAQVAVAQRIQQSANSTIAGGGWNQNVGYGTIGARRAITGNLRPATLGGIVGQVVDTSGLPVNGSQLAVNGQSLVTGSDGLYRFSNLLAGTYPLTVTAPSFATVTLNVTVAAGADNTATIMMGVNLGTFSGYVDSGGLPLVGAVVQALSNNLIKGSAVTDVTGTYYLAVPAGTYNLRASAFSRVTTTMASQTVGTNGNQAVNLSLPALGVVSGIVTDEDQQPVPDAQLTLTSGAFTAGAVTNSNGEYTTLGLPSGTYSVTASAIGQQAKTVGGIFVTSDATTEVDFQLLDVKVTISPTSAELTPSQTQQFTATVDGDSNTDVKWSLSSSLGTVSPTGLYTAPASLTGTKTVEVIAASVAHPNRSAKATVTVRNVFVLTISPATLAGGGSTTLKVTLDDPAPADGALVALASSDQIAAPAPSSISVAPGAKVATYTIVTSFVANSKTVTLSASYGGANKMVTLTVIPLAVSGLYLSPGTMTEGTTSASHKVTLNGPAPPGGAVVTLTGSNPSAATVAASATVAAGATSATFTINTLAVSASTQVIITASYEGSSKTATLTVVPLAVSGLYLSPGTMTEGTTSASQRVTLNGPAPPGGAVVTLTGSNASAATVAASATVAAGATSATFTINALAVSTSTQVIITASYEGSSKTATLTVVPLAVSGVYLAPGTMTEGTTSASHKVTLNGPAPPGGAVVMLTGSNPSAATVAASATVAAGATSATFTINALAVSASTQVIITASYEGSSKTATLTVKP